jgi:hypothetical protein
MAPWQRLHLALQRFGHVYRRKPRRPFERLKRVSPLWKPPSRPSWNGCSKMRVPPHARHRRIPRSVSGPAASPVDATLGGTLAIRARPGQCCRQKRVPWSFRFSPRYAPVVRSRWRAMIRRPRALKWRRGPLAGRWSPRIIGISWYAPAGGPRPGPLGPAGCRQAPPGRGAKRSRPWVRGRSACRNGPPNGSWMICWGCR